MRETCALQPVEVTSDLVFSLTIRSPSEPRHVNRVFTKLVKIHELRRWRLHDLRHPCASLLLARARRHRTLPLKPALKLAVLVTLDVNNARR